MKNGNGALKVDKGIPIPKGSPAGRPLSQEARTLGGMKKGESVLLDKQRGAVTALALRYIGKGKYTLRHVEGGFRVWRIA